MVEIWLLRHDGEAVAHGISGKGNDRYLHQLLVENYQTMAGARKEGRLIQMPYRLQDQST
jgi:hypothetical protein